MARYEIGDYARLATFSKVIAHDLRVRLLIEYDDQPRSPYTMALVVGERVSAVRYHTTELRKCGALERIESRASGNGAKDVHAITDLGSEILMFAEVAGRERDE
ncbi:MAG TPA: hypothetical protein VJL81_03820 [Solirubrobacterales bacterium]|nr:hypothetical protein [Solirubrobacterales bacterium]